MPTWSGVAYLHVARAVLVQARGDGLALRQAVSGLLAGSVRTHLERGPNWMWRVSTGLDAFLGQRGRRRGVCSRVSRR